MSDQWGDPDPLRAWQPGGPPAPSAPPPPPYFPQPGWGPPAWVPPPLPPPVPWLPRIVAALRTAVPTILLLVLLGAPVALLWHAVAPGIDVAKTAQGPVPSAVESSQVFAVDGSYVAVTLVVGLLLGAGAWPLLRRRGPAGPVALAIGATTAAYVTAAVGNRIVVDRYLYDQCRKGCYVYTGTLHLHAYAAVVVWPAATVAVFALLTWLADRDPAPTP